MCLLMVPLLVVVEEEGEGEAEGEGEGRARLERGTRKKSKLCDARPVLKTQAQFLPVAFAGAKLQPLVPAKPVLVLFSAVSSQCSDA